MIRATGASSALAMVVAFAALGCSASIAPSRDAGRDALAQDSGVDARAVEASVDVVTQDRAPEVGAPDVAATDVATDGATVPCSDIQCAAGEICVHQGFMEDGGFRECDRACAPAPPAGSTCATVGDNYCRLACFGMTHEAIYCACD